MDKLDLVVYGPEHMASTVCGATSYYDTWPLVIELWQHTAASRWSIIRPWAPATVPAEASSVQDRITLLGYGTTQQLEENVTLINNILAQAEEWYKLGQPYAVYIRWAPEGRYLASDPTRQEYRWARVRRGLLRKTKWGDLERAAEHPEAVLEIEYDIPRRPTPIVLKNLLLNPSAEYDTNADGTPDGWTLSGTATVARTAGSYAAFHGRYCFSLSGGGASDYLRSAPIAVTAGSVYNVAYRCGLGAGAGYVKIEVRNDATNALIDTLSSANDTPRCWELVGKQVEIPGGCANIHLRLLRSSTTTGMWDAIYFGSQDYEGKEIVAGEGLWADYYLLNNHDDTPWDNVNGQPGNSPSTDHEHLDVLGCPGDRAPVIRLLTTDAGNIADQPRLGLVTDRLVATRLLLSLQAENATRWGGSALATVAGASGPAVNNCLSLPLVAGLTAFAHWHIADDLMLLLAGKMFRVYAQLRAAVAADYDVTWGIGVSPSAGSRAPAAVYTASLWAATSYWWYLLPGPTIAFPPYPAKVPEYDATLLMLVPPPHLLPLRSTSLDFYAAQAAGNDVYLDRILLVGLDGLVESYWYEDVGPQHLFGTEGIFTVNGADVPDNALDARGQLDRWTPGRAGFRLQLNQRYRWQATPGGANTSTELYLFPRWSSL